MPSPQSQQAINYATHSEKEGAWDAMSEAQKIEWLAVEVMGWHVHEEWPEWWDGEKYTGFAIENYGQPVDRERFRPLTDWNHFRQIEERLMEDGKGKRIKEYLKWFDGKGHYMGADLPERCQALFLSSL